MNINNDWLEFFEDEFHKKYFFQLQEFIKKEYKTKIIYPKYENIFRAFNLVKVTEVKVVIIGQDPYHGSGQANGLAFSVSKHSKIPPSLKNIYKELMSDINCETPFNGDLSHWAKQGVLLINTVFTVIASNAHSHKNIGWEIFTDSIINKLSTDLDNVVFILWGGPAQKKELLIDENKHCILKSPHPSPLSSYRGFFGSKPFSKSNTYLSKHNKKIISWCLPSEQILL